MSDIVERLRWTYRENYPVMDAAADEIEKLRALLEEAAADLALYVDQEHQLRDTYPDEMRRYKRDMELVNRIREAIRGEADRE